MPKLTSLFDSFDNLDQIPTEAIVSWIKPVPDLNQLENYLANRILYPQTLPISEQDMKLDLSILREALKINGPKNVSREKNALLGDNPFINVTLRKVIIPAKFLNFVPDIKKLAFVFIDALLLNRQKQDWFQDLWKVVLTDDSDEMVGSVLLPQFEDSGGIMNLRLQNKNYQIRPGNLVVIPCPQDRCEIAYRLQKGKVLGKAESAIEIYGGKLGLVIDGRSV